MKNNRALKWLMSLALAVGIAVVGCRKKAEEPTQTVQPPTEVTKQQEEVKQEEAQPTEKPEKKPEEQGSFISRLPEIVETFTSTALQNMGGMGKMVSKESKLTFLEEDAQMVFPKSLGGFEMDYIGMPDSGFADMKKRPYCISYLSEELMSSICILVEPIPLDPMGNPMDLSACQSRMQKQIEQVSMGMTPMALYDKENEKNYATANRSAVNGFNLGDSTDESKFNVSGTPYRSISWSWRCPNGRMAQYLVGEKGLHSAGMFWRLPIMRRSPMSSISYNGPMGPIANPAGEQTYQHTAVVMQKGSRLLSVIVQSEGGEASANHPKAIEQFTAALDKEALSVSNQSFINILDENYENSEWGKLAKTPVKFYSALKSDMTEDELSKCLSKSDIEGKSFLEICGVNHETKLNYSKASVEGRLADAMQSLILYIEDYCELPFATDLGIVFMGPKGLVDSDILLSCFASKAKMDDEDREKSMVQAKILREKILFRNRQVGRISRIIANNRQRRLHAVEREIDAKRTAELVAYIKIQQERFYNVGGSDMNAINAELMNTVKHIIDELKSAKVSPRLFQNDDKGYMASDVTYAINIITSWGNLDDNTRQALRLKIVKTLFDLGEDSQTLMDLRNAILGYHNSMENALAYMLSNGLELENSPNIGINYDNLWSSPRIARLLILSNFPPPSYTMFNILNTGKMDVLKELLLADTAPVNERCNGQLPLAIAIMRGNTELEQLLLANGANPELTDGNGKKPEEYRVYGLYWNALNSKDYKTQKECLDKGMDPNRPTPEGQHYLDFAIRLKDTQAVKILLEAKTELSQGYMYLQMAINQGQFEIFKLLLDHGAPLEQDGNSILQTVLIQSASNSPDFLKELITRLDKSKLNEECCFLQGNRNGLKVTPACFAICMNNGYNDNADTLLKKLKILEEAGTVIVRQPTPQSLSPLYYAISKPYVSVDIYSYLLSKDLDLNSITAPKSLNAVDTWRLGDEIASKGVEKTAILTILMRQCVKKNINDSRLLNNVLPYLVEKGAKADVKDSYGKTCLDYLEALKSNQYLYKSYSEKFKLLGLR